MRFSLFASIVLLLAALPVMGSQPRPFSAHDLVAMERISDPQVAPGGEEIAFVRRTTDFEADKGRTDIWIVGVDGSGLRRVTTDEAGDSSPRWSADGRAVYFLSSRSGSSQVWRIPRDGGAAVQATDLPLDIGSLTISPDGKTMAISMEVFVDCEDVDCTVKRLEERDEQKPSGVIYKQLLFRHWDTWADGRRSHLFVMPLTGGDPVDVTAGMEADIPSKPFGGAEELTFTPDGSGLVFTARNVGASEAWSTDFDLYFVPADGSQSPRCLTEANEAWDTQPVFSPDGKTLAYLAMARPGFEADRFRIVLRDWPDGGTRELTADWDRSARGVLFSEDGGTIYTTAADVGQVALFSISVASGEPTKIVGAGHVRSPALAGNRIVFGRDDLRSPVELYSIKRDGSELQQITDINGEALASVVMGEPDQFTFRGANNETVHAYVVKPAEFDAGNKYPVAFLIHGGPQGSFGNDFHYRWNPQTYAGAGYAAVMVDFHGSTGYGQAFTDSISGDWGGKPLEDLQKGLATALDRYAWMDGERVCALGASYGGYMINWIAGNWPDRFNCLVNHDGIFDQRMMYYATEELWFPEWEHGGTYWTASEGFELHNPAQHVDKWRTPMLVVHGANDYRIPDTQAMATFTALQRKGVASEFLYFPDENHWVLRPSNSLQWHGVVHDWLDRWLAPGCLMEE
ncbi:MAG: S9 family peptidase [Thermoanaerobaculia bacterium]